MRRLFDSITARDIPAGSELVAGYIDGAYRWLDSDWALFPDRIKVRIAVLPSTDDGHVLDVEPGDATPTQALDWVRMRRAAGMDPTVYTGISDWQAVRDAFQTSGLAEPHYWIAHYDGDARLLDGVVAKQYANPTLTGGHFDASVVADYWPGVDNMTPEEAKAIAVQAIADAGLDPNTVAVIKKKLDHHVHLPGTVQTTQPLFPPAEGVVYAGSSADFSQTFWLYPDGVVRNQDGQPKP